MTQEERLNETTERFSRRLGEKPGLGDGSCFEGHKPAHYHGWPTVFRWLAFYLSLYLLYVYFK